MPLPPPLRIDESNRSAHYYFREEHECYFFHEYTAREGPRHSIGNQLVFNLKKPVTRRGQADYPYKELAIGQAGAMLRAALERSDWVFRDATFAAIPSSKIPGHPEYDDRMQRVVQIACAGKGADVRDVIIQQASYEASHHQADGARKKPPELEAIYRVCQPGPKGTVILVDDV